MEHEEQILAWAEVMLPSNLQSRVRQLFEVGTGSRMMFDLGRNLGSIEQHALEHERIHPLAPDSPPSRVEGGPEPVCFVKDEKLGTYSMTHDPGQVVWLNGSNEDQIDIRTWARPIRAHVCKRCGVVYVPKGD